MSIGKYSPFCPPGKEFIFNCYGKIPAPWTKELNDAGVPYDIKTMYDNFDDEGFDSYGYSCFRADGTFRGLGQGVDRDGLTESDYLAEHLRLLDSEDTCYGGFL